ncbi:MAG: hypothetical protein QOE61_734 [Micromonosporaceae bacterium]|jgi:hypothetical protein|nr:hypothetical protein [Micromonosporaceae bacterium]
MVDLTPLGEPPSQLGAPLSTAITVPLQLNRQRIGGLVTDALAYMGSGIRFLEPDKPSAK